jgi:ADP-heptose:LPS heptosyltransferase
MNFPGLDPAWSLFHHAAHGAGLLRTWPLAEIRRQLRGNERVLVVATTALGDSLLTLPLIETLSRQIGSRRVSLLVKAPYAELYRNDPRVARVFTVRGKYRWKKLRAELTADPHRIALLANLTEPDLTPFLWWCGVRGFLRYRSRWSRYPGWMANGEMLRRPGKAGYATGHAIENNLAMAAALGFEPATHRLALPQFRKEEKFRRVLIHPGASREIKQWPVEYWARLADAVADEFNLEVLITGTGRERDLANAVKGAMKFAGRAEVLAGDFSLRQLAETQAGALAFLSGDTGPYHLAVAVGCPTVTLFAPTDRGSSVEACGPHHADPGRHRIVETERLGDAVETISPERVWAEVRELLGVTASTRPG